MKEIERPQTEVLAELDKVADLVFSPDTVNTRLVPRLQRLEETYVPAYPDAFMTLASLQDELSEARTKAAGSAELSACSAAEEGA